MSDTERQGSAALSPSDLAGIKARAEAATPGPWKYYDPNEGIWPPRAHHCVANDEFHNPTGTDDDPWLAVDISVNTGTKADAAHIAGMDPTTTLALLADLARARDAVTRVRELARQWSDPTVYSLGYQAELILAALDADAAAGGEQT